MSVEDSPEFKKALQEACEGQYRSWLYGGGVIANSKDKIGDVMEEFQRKRRGIEEEARETKLHVESIRRDADARRRETELLMNPHAREITENLHKLHAAEGSLVCPQCRETLSHGNKMNGKPFCFRCQLPMISKEKAENWVKPKKPKIKSYTFNDPDEVVRLWHR